MTIFLLSLSSLHLGWIYCYCVKRWMNTRWHLSKNNMTFEVCRKEENTRISNGNDVFLDQSESGTWKKNMFNVCNLRLFIFSNKVEENVWCISNFHDNSSCFCLFLSLSLALSLLPSPSLPTIKSEQERTK